MTPPILLQLPLEVHTEHLLLRVPRTGDGESLHEAIAESVVELRRFLASLPWVAAEQSVESSEIFCRNAESNFIARRDLPYLMWEKASGSVIGATGLHRTDWNTPKTEIGYWCRTSRTGKGFTSEAVEALVEVAFEQLKVSRVELITDAENLGSRRVAQRCRFELEGILRNERRAPDGTLRNTCVYSRLPPEA